MHYYTEMIGLLAGTIICVASLPRAIAIWRDERNAMGESMIRNGAFVLGNSLWVLYGTLQPSLAVTVVCGFNTIVNFYIFWKARQVQRKPAA